MALNQNHLFEDLGEIKCAIAEKNCTPERVAFLKELLELNGFQVVVVPSPPPKAPVPANPENQETVEIPETFTLGVTDVTFNPIKAMYNRELKTPSGKIVNPAYWKQEISNPEENSWYWKD